VDHLAALKRSTMWPVMTLTLLLQLTDDEQLYAEAPTVQQQPVEQAAPAAPAEEAPAAEWPAEQAANG
jgi:hypothetical protein